MAGNTPPAEGQLTDHRYTWDVGSGLPVILQETVGAQTTYHVYGLDLIASVQGTTPTYYLTDGLGSTRQLTDGAGSVTGTYAYDVFGPVRTHTGASTEWSYTGEQNDPTGLEYLRARYYDPAVGRFLTQDPIPFIQRYAYVGNNPIRFTDPYGLWCPPGAGWACDKAGDVAEAVEAGVEWLGEDYHWATVGAAVGGTAFAGGVVLLSGGTAAPLAAVLMSGGLGVGVPLTTLSVAHSGKECAGGDKGACVSAGVGGVSAPLGFSPGFLTSVTFEWIPVLADILISALEGPGGQGSALPGQSGQGKE